MIQMKRAISVLVLLFVAKHAVAGIPVDYYITAKGQTERGLKTALHRIISTDYEVVSYSELWTIYEQTDIHSDGRVWDMYSSCDWIYAKEQCGGSYKNVCDCYNREHSIPQSWFNKAAPMKSDAFHVYPTDGKVNGQRSNYPFGECDNGESLGGNALGRLGKSTFAGYTGTVFEPDDEYKGDFARTYFYFVTCYENRMKNFQDDATSFERNTYPSLNEWSLNLFLKWHRQDPVSEKEIDRNEAVYNVQRNRNPFIDHPELAEFIWGNRKGEPWGGAATLVELVTIPDTWVTDGVLHIECSDELVADYTIYNMLGLIMDRGVLHGSTEIQLPTVGMYILAVKKGTQYIVRRFVVK